MPTTPTLPANQTGLAQLSPGQQLTFDPAVPWAFDGTQPFSVTMWVRFHESQAVLFAAGDQFILSLDEQQLSARFGAGATAFATPALMLSRWYHLSVVFNPQGEGGSTLTLYVDGVVSPATVVDGVGQSPATPVTANPADNRFDLWRLSDWSIALTSDQVQACKFHDPAPNTVGLEASWEFAQVPVVDGSGHNRTAVFSEGAGQVIITPGVVLQGQAYCVPTTPINPTAGSFTIQTWFQVLDPASSEPQYLFATAPGASFVALSVQLNPENGTFSTMLNVGSKGGGKSGLAFETGRWYNLAATFDAESAAVALYLDGSLLSHGTLATVAPDPDPQPVVGAVPSGSGHTGYFQGQIQTLAIWPSVLDAETVNARRYPLPVGAETPLAIYDFALPPGRDLISGEPVRLLGGAVLSEQPMVTDADFHAAYAEVETQHASFRAEPADEAAILAGLQSQHEGAFFDRAQTADHPAFSVESEAAQLDVILGMMPQGIDSHTLAAARTAARTNVATTFAAARAGALPMAGVIRHEVIDDHYVWFHHTTEGATAVMRASTDALDPCTAWMIDMGGTVFFGLLTLFDVPVTPSTVTNILKKLLATDKVALAFASALAGEITVNTYIALVKALDDTDYLTTFALDILDSLSWYDYLFFVGEVLVEFLALLFPTAELAIILGKLALFVGQLIAVSLECPAGCVG